MTFETTRVVELPAPAIVVKAQLASVPAGADAEGFGGQSPPTTVLIGGSTVMQQLVDTVRRISETTVSVLIHGETGSGKELVARLIHDCSRRNSGPFCAVNCAALPAGLIESTLFGHEKGAFTGATHAQLGVFERAHGGTLFLDELGELNAGAQAALLRVLETRHVSRIGGHREIPVDVRVVAATHRNLQTMLTSETFRADLLFRLNTMTLEVPPLRRRIDELPALLNTFVARACKEWDRPVPNVAPEVLDTLRAYAFPGNIRELKNLVERAVAVCDGNTILLSHFPEAIQAVAPVVPIAETRRLQEVLAVNGTLRARLRAFERHLLLEVLEQSQGNQLRAAELAGLPLRTFSRRLAQLGIKRPTSRPPPASAR